MLKAMEKQIEQWTGKGRLFDVWRRRCNGDALKVIAKDLDLSIERIRQIDQKCIYYIAVGIRRRLRNSRTDRLRHIFIYDLLKYIDDQYLVFVEEVIKELK